MKNIFICLTFDTDPDISFNTNQIDSKNKKIVGWEGLEIGKNLIYNSIKKIERKYKINIPQSWFVRVDDQIKFYHNRSDWLLIKYQKFWKKILNNRGSIEWHIHLNRRKNYNDGWILEKNHKIINKIIKRNLKIFKFHHNLNCIRIGEAFMTNEIAKLIYKLGISADSSCLPGRKRLDKIKFFDWSNSKNEPYFMSRSNYKNAVKLKKKRLLEIPMNTKLTKCSYDKNYLKRYINLSFHKKYFNQNLKNFLKEKNFLVTMTHPYEIVKKFKNKKNSKLISFSYNEFETNLDNIICTCKKIKKNPIFVNTQDLIQIIQTKYD